MILLDTNVISEALKREPDPSVQECLDTQAAETWHVCSVTFAELLFGFGVLRAAKREGVLAASFESALQRYESGRPGAKKFDIAVCLR